MVNAIFKCDSDTNSSEVDRVSIKLQLSLVPNKISASGGKRGMVSYMQLGGIGGMSYTFCFGRIAGFETVDLCFKQKIISEVPVGPKTTHFWGPVANCGFVVAGLVDMQNPPEMISGNMSAAMCVFWIIHEVRLDGAAA
uniref:Mitochondrial pyruvate carrier n=1 Tax=Helianthus annuus TaxID=4232 RepID=A0A251UZF8_HELAN